MKKIKDKILHNLPLKVLALVIAMLLWLVVINLNDPVIDKQYNDVQVELINGDELAGEGKVYEILENTGTVTVTVSAPRSVIESLSTDDIHAVADLTQITVSDTVEISAYSDRYNDNIEKVYIPNSFLKLSIENSMQAQVYIAPEVNGEPAEGYIVGDVTTSQNIVRINGPESLISIVESAVVSVDISGMTSSISTNTEIILFDGEGNVVQNDSIIKNVDDVSVDAQILATKTVPITYETMGSVASGYVLNGVITSNPATVLIAGVEEDLDRVNEIQIPETELNVTGVNADLIQVVNIAEYLPDGIVLGNSEYSGMATATVGLEREEYGTYIIDEQMVVINNAQAGYEIIIEEFANDLTLEVAGLGSTVDNLSTANVRAAVDLNDLLAVNGWEELRVGTYEMVVDVSLPEDVRLTNEVSIVINVEELATSE